MVCVLFYLFKCNDQIFLGIKQEFTHTFFKSGINVVNVATVGLTVYSLRLFVKSLGRARSILESLVQVLANTIIVEVSCHDRVFL